MQNKLIHASGSLHQLKDFNGLDGWGIFLDKVLDEFAGLSVNDPENSDNNNNKKRKYVLPKSINFSKINI